MKEFEKALLEDYKDASEQLKILKVGDDGYKEILEDRNNVRNEILKIKQIESENNREKVRNWITVGTCGVSVLYGIWTVNKTFKFDQVATVTSTLGRNILNGALPKIFKR